MSSNEKATVLAAAIGGLCVFLAAVIGLFTPIVTRVSERFLAPPSATALPTETSLPTFTPTPTPTATLTPPAVLTETPNPSLVLLVYNNFGSDQDLYVDGVLGAAVDSGSYATMRILRGSHILTTCARGASPDVNPESCVARTYVVQEDPFFWELPGNMLPTGDSTFIVRNISSLDIDFFVDGVFTTPIDRAKYTVLLLKPGVHGFQAAHADTTRPLIHRTADPSAALTYKVLSTRGPFTTEQHFLDLSSKQDAQALI